MGTTEPAGLPNWRDAAAYRFELLDRPGFAWEWLRRDPAYRDAAAAACSGRRFPSDASSAVRWGLVAFADPALAAPVARPLWRAECDTSVLVAEAVACDPGDPDAVSIADLGGLATLVRCGEGEHLLLTDGWRRVRMDIRAGTCRAGPICLHWTLHGIRSAAPRIVALQRLLSVLRTRRFANRLWPPDPRTRRWTLALRAHDALAAGAPHRDLAELLAVGDLRAPRWRVHSPALRLQAQRLAALARALQGRGFAGRYLAGR